MPIRARLISPTNLLLEHPLFQPIADCEFIVCGKAEYEAQTKKHRMEGVQFGLIIGFCIAMILAAILMPSPARGQELFPTKPATTGPVQRIETHAKTLDWKYWTVISGLGAAKSADYYTTQRQPSSWPEQNPLFGRKPSNLRLTAVGGGIFAGEAYLAYRLKRSHSWVRHVWWMEPLASAAIHSRYAAKNARAYDQRQCWIHVGSLGCFR